MRNTIEIWRQDRHSGYNPNQHVTFSLSRHGDFFIEAQGNLDVYGVNYFENVSTSESHHRYIPSIVTLSVIGNTYILTEELAGNHEYLLMKLYQDEVYFVFKNSSLEAAKLCLENMRICYDHTLVNQNKFSLDENETLVDELQELQKLIDIRSSAKKILENSNFINSKNYEEGLIFFHSDRHPHTRHTIIYAFTQKRYIEEAENSFNLETDSFTRSFIDNSIIFITLTTDNQIQVNFVNKTTSQCYIRLNCYKIPLVLDQDENYFPLDFALKFTLDWNLTPISLGKLSKMIAFKAAQLFAASST